MCILFTYTNSKDVDGDYSLIIASNRDEYYDRPAVNMAPWDEDPDVFGGRDIKAGGTWLAISPQRGKLGVLLNVPGSNNEDAKSRGRLVTDYMKCSQNTEEYIASMVDYIKDCNGFVLVTAEFGNCQYSVSFELHEFTHSIVEKYWKSATVQAYCNVQDSLNRYEEGCHGFSNSDPLKPLTKVQVGQEKFRDICNTFGTIGQKEQLVEGLLALLKSDERHLPDPQLEERQPNLYKEFSSIFVQIPKGRYGTRTHTIVLVTKTGHIDVIEVNLVAPIDPLKPKWEMGKYEFILKNFNKGEN